jgi:hypothetical protein
MRAVRREADAVAALGMSTGIGLPGLPVSPWRRQRHSSSEGAGRRAGPGKAGGTRADFTYAPPALAGEAEGLCPDSLVKVEKAADKREVEHWGPRCARSEQERLERGLNC